MISSVQIKYALGSPASERYSKNLEEIGNERKGMVFERYPFLQHHLPSEDMKSLLASFKKRKRDYDEDFKTPNDNLERKRKSGADHEVDQHENLVPQPLDVITETVSPAYLLLKTRQLGFSKDLNSAEKTKNKNPRSDSTFAETVDRGNPTRKAQRFRLSCNKLKSDKDEKYAKELRSIYRSLNRVAAQLDALSQKAKPKTPKVPKICSKVALCKTTTPVTIFGLLSLTSTKRPRWKTSGTVKFQGKSTQADDRITTSGYIVKSDKSSKESSDAILKQIMDDLKELKKTYKNCWFKSGVKDCQSCNRTMLEQIRDGVGELKKMNFLQCGIVTEPIKPVKLLESSNVQNIDKDIGVDKDEEKFSLLETGSFQMDPILEAILKDIDELKANYKRQSG